MAEISLPTGVTTIEMGAFYGCTGLEKISLPEKLTSIGMYAFGECRSLSNIVLPENLSTIDIGAFYECSGLNNIYIPAGITSISGASFTGCTGLTEIVVDDGNTSYCDIDGVLFNIEQTELMYYPGSNPAKRYSVPESVNTIWSTAFWRCANLTSVSISSDVTSIGRNPFPECNNLMEILVDAENTSYSDIDGVLFNKEETNLICYPASHSGTEYTIPEGVLTIEEDAFDGCVGLSKITIPGSVQTAFAGCTGITSIELPTDMHNISFGAFTGCTNLTKIIFVENAFYGDWVNSYYDIVEGEHNEQLAIYGYQCNVAAQKVAERSNLPYIVLENIVSYRFTDIPADAWYTTSVQYVYDNGIMSGKSENWFDAMGTLTRAEFVTTLYSSCGRPAIGEVENIFPDVKPDTWYTIPILWANNVGYVSGYDTGYFGTDDPITREQLALILYKNGRDVVSDYDSNILDAYLDVQNISSYALEAMQWAVSNHIMSGTPEMHLNPKGKASRAECATMLAGYNKMLEEARVK